MQDESSEHRCERCGKPHPDGEFDWPWEGNARLVGRDRRATKVYILRHDGEDVDDVVERAGDR